MTWLLIVLAGGVGAVLRAELSAGAADSDAPRLGTTIANLVGALLLGFLVGTTPESGEPTLLAHTAGTGLLGGFTTFSTWMVQTVEQPRERWSRAVAWPLVLGIVLATVGVLAGQAL